MVNLARALALISMLAALAACQLGDNIKRDFDTVVAKVGGQTQAPETDYKQGLRYKEGVGVEQDDALAADYFRKAADAGHADAQFRLGLALQTGSGVTKDAEAALRRYRAAGEQGHPEAQYMTGLLHWRGVGVARDRGTATTWFARAAAQDHREAQYYAGLAYATGEGVGEDDKRALGYFEAAGTGDHPQAAFLAGDAYGNGRGIAKDHAWAARWYGRAARLGVKRAQYRLGIAHGAGLGLPKNEAMGYRWFTLVARSGSKKAAKLRDALGDKVNPAEKARAETWADGFTPAKATPAPDPSTVLFIQFALRQLGFDPGPVDGLAGPRTKRALKEFAEREKLEAGDPFRGDVVDRLREVRLRLAGP